MAYSFPFATLVPLDCMSCWDRELEWGHQTRNNIQRGMGKIWYIEPHEVSCLQVDRPLSPLGETKLQSMY